MTIECCNEVIDHYLRTAFLHAYPNLGSDVNFYVSTGKVDVDSNPDVVVQQVAAARSAAAAEQEQAVARRRAGATEAARQRATHEDEVRSAAARKDYYEVEGSRAGRDSVACAKLENLERALAEEAAGKIVVDRNMDSDVQNLGCFIVRRGDVFLLVEDKGEYRRVVSTIYGTDFWVPGKDLIPKRERR